jgi:ribonuclease Z
VLNLTILGTGSATPILLRNPSAQVLSNEYESYLIDCGEGTQNQLIKYKIKTNKIKHIFISHLHGDHFFGLIGLLSSFNLAHRTEPLTIFGPKGLDDIITIQLKYSGTFLHFKLTFTAINTTIDEVIVENEIIKITTIPLIHRIPCCGFLFEKKPKNRNIIKGKINEHFSIEEIKQLKEGKNVLHEDLSIKYSVETHTKAHSSAKYAYCSDTAFNEQIIPQIEKVDLLYHEATFKEDLIGRAAVTFHSTAMQAAKIAKSANVNKLLIGHFSSRYIDLDENLAEAKSIFTNTEIAIEGNQYEIGN